MNLVLLGHYRPGYRLSYYLDWRDGFRASRAHAVRIINTATGWQRPAMLRDRLPLAWSLPAREVQDLFAGRIPCDVLVLPPSFYYFNLGRRRRFLEDVAARGHRRFSVVYFVENEYRYLPDKVAYAKALGASVLVSQFPPEVARSLYGPHFPGTIVSAPAGLNPDVYRPGLPMMSRRLDVGTRSHLYPASFGDGERNTLLERFMRGGGPIDGLTVDISVDEKRRLSREQWARFLADCRATVATEAGARELAWGDGYPTVSGRAVSSRHFEALGTKTAQIMFPGRFNDLLRAGEHYIPLQRDFRNLDEVCAAVRNPTLLTRLTDAGYEFAMSSHTYRHRVDTVLRAV